MEINNRKRVLWVDTDTHILEPYYEYLETKGYDVKPCTTLTEGEEELVEQKFDIVILDIMIAPTEDEELHGAYSGPDAELGMQAGLIFYQRMKPYLDKYKTPVLILTQRFDLGIRDKFEAVGLPRKAFARKIDLPKAHQVLQKIEQMLSE